MLSAFFWIATIFLFFLGAVIGSFLNVLIYRTAEGEDWKTGRSRCDHCRKKIAWFDNIPLLSFLLLGGKCRHCRKSIALSHIVVEFLTGVLFVWWYWFGFFFFQLSQEPYLVIQPLFWLLAGIILLVIFVADWRYYIIPDGAAASLLVLALLYRAALSLSGVMQWHDFWMSLLAAAAGTLFFFSLWYFTRGKGMGFGDVKLIGSLCLLMGFPRAIVGIFGSFIFGAVVGIVLLSLGKKKLKQPIPFGPFMIAATFFALVWGDELIQWYVNLL